MTEYSTNIMILYLTDYYYYFKIQSSIPSTVPYVLVAKTNKTSVTVQWRMPASNGAPIHTVAIQCKGGKLAPQFGEGTLGQAIVVEAQLALKRGEAADDAGEWRGDAPSKNKALDRAKAAKKRKKKAKKKKKAKSSNGLEDVDGDDVEETRIVKNVSFFSLSFYSMSDYFTTF